MLARVAILLSPPIAMKDYKSRRSTLSVRNRRRARLPLLPIGAALLLAAAGTVFAIIQLGDDGDEAAEQPTARPNNEGVIPLPLPPEPAAIRQPADSG